MTIQIERTRHRTSLLASVPAVFAFYPFGRRTRLQLHLAA